MPYYLKYRYKSFGEENWCHENAISMLFPPFLIQEWNDKRPNRYVLDFYQDISHDLYNACLSRKIPNWNNSNNGL